MQSLFLNDVKLIINFRMNYENCKEILEKFVKISKRSNGKINLKEFSNYLELPPEGAVAEVFKLYDRVNIEIIYFSFL